jgi:hypothetical protein
MATDILMLEHIIDTLSQDDLQKVNTILGKNLSKATEPVLGDNGNELDEVTVVWCDKIKYIIFDNIDNVRKHIEDCQTKLIDFVMVTKSEKNRCFTVTNYISVKHITSITKLSVAEIENFDYPGRNKNV